MRGDALLEQAAQRAGVDLLGLVAACSIWTSPPIVRAVLARRKNAVWFPYTRRARTMLGERRGQIVDGCRLDDNSAANLAIKQAVFEDAGAGCSGMACCHVWPTTCYDPRYHTSLANLVLIPSPLASLTDHHAGVAAMLKRRSFELFDWLPLGEQAPAAPKGYPAAHLWATRVEPGPAVRRRVEQKIQTLVAPFA